MPDGMRKVMVVEDSDDYAFLLSRALNHSRRFQVVWRAKDGQEAISYLGGAGQFGDRQRFPFPDAVLLDMVLPVKDGFEVLKWASDQRNKPKLVMLTVLENEPKRQKALSSGADEFKVKPYDNQEMTEFMRWLDEWIGSAQRPPATADVPPRQTRSRKPASQGKPQRRGLSRDACAADRNRRLER
jgi:DNA-binding response OmpR family regulator